MGKRTTTRHKEENTFKFETFEEKLRNITVNVSLSIRDGRTDVPEEETTFFFQEIEKWVDLNRTESFGNLLSEIGEDVKSLPQVVVQKDRLAELLLKQLQDRDNVLSYEPTFALTIALSRDLGKEFYPFFPKFVNAIIDIVISLKKSDIIEQGFRCFAYLSKYLRREIVRDMPQQFKLFAPLLNPKLKNYVVIFACEAFEVAVAKYARDHSDSFLDMLFRLLLKNKPEHATGVATLLFSIFKGVGGSLKIMGPGLKLSSCIDYIFKLKDEEREIWIEVLKALLVRLVNHANDPECKKLFELFEGLLINPERRQQSPLVFPLYQTLIELENCAKIPDVGKSVVVLKILTDCAIENQEEMFKSFIQTMITLIQIKGKSTNPEILNSLRPTISKVLLIGKVEHVQEVDRVLQDTTHYFHSYLTTLVTAYERLQAQEGSPRKDNQALKCISAAVLRQNGFYHNLKKEQHLFTGFAQPMWFYENQRKLIRPLNMVGLLSKEALNCCDLMSTALESLTSSVEIAALVKLFLTYSRISTTECKDCLKRCVEIANTVIDLHEVCEDTQKSTFSMVLLFILETLITHGVNEASLKSLSGVNISKFLLSIENVVTDAATGKQPFCIWSLKCLDLLVHYAKLSEENEDVVKFVSNLNLASNLQSGFKIVRTLTLSILRNLLVTQERDDKLTEMCGRFMEIEDTSIMDPRFGALVKSTLTEATVVIESESSSEEIKKFCLQYTLGLMYSNFSPIWSNCIEVIKLAGKNMTFPEFWKVFENQFQIHFPGSSSGQPRSSILMDGENCDEFLRQIHELTFAFPKTLANNLGSQEVLDVAQYRVNLWKSLVGLPVGKVQYQTIRPLVEKTISNSFEGLTTSGEMHKTLVPVLQFLEKSDIAYSENLWEKALDHLMTSADIQKAAWEFLHAKRRNKLKEFKEDIDELIKNESMDCYHKFRVDAIDTTKNQQYQIESVEKRRLLMEIVIRILIGKEKKWKTDKRLQAIRFIGGCTAWEAQKYLDLTVGQGLKDLRMSPKILEIKINKISHCIQAWRYKFPTILEELLTMVCDLACATRNLRKPLPRHVDEEELPTEVFEEQKKGALKAARLCLIAFFTFLPKFNLDEITLNKVFDTFIWDGLEEMKVQTSNSPSWILKLFLVWSSHSRFHILFSKCRDDDENYSPMTSIFRLLECPTIPFEIQKYLIGILLNLTTPPELDEKEDDDQSVALEHSEKYDGRALKCSGFYHFDTDTAIIPVGLQIVLKGKKSVLKLFEDVQLFKKFVNQPGGDRCLTLISRLAEFINEKDDENSVEKLTSIIIETFTIYKNSEDNLFNCLDACKHLLPRVVDRKSLFLKLAGAFVWINGKRLRGALCDCLKSHDAFEMIRDMNAWSELMVETPEFAVRQNAFQELERDLLQKPFEIVTWTLAATNCFYNLLNESDIGMKNSAKNLLTVMASFLEEKSLNKACQDDLKTFMDATILPRLRGGIHHKDDSRFADFLEVYIAFISHAKELHGTFKELDLVLSPDIVQGLIDIQIHLRTRAMNKLCGKISDAGGKISPSTLKNYVLPLANHNLLDEDKLGENRSDLIHSSIETLKTILTLLPQDHYFKQLILLVNTPKKKTRLAKQYERILVAAMDAFHFDLSQGCDYPAFMGKKKDEKEEADKESNNAAVNNEEDGDGDSNSESETKEEAPVSSKFTTGSITLVPKPAATKCLGLLKNIIVPKLREYLNFEEKATHKLSRSEKKVDDDVILKIPCTLALVKLLKKLPKSESETSIRSIIPCLCAGLRNELYSTRHSIRKTLLNVIKELGISHLRQVVGYMKATLQRGYQKHVLNFSVGYFLKCLEPELRLSPTSLPIKEILPLCEDELYSVMQEEKELAAIKTKTREAGKNNAIPILKLCGKCIQDHHQFWSLIEPALNQLSLKRSPRVSKTTRQWLTSVSEGLADNVVVDHLSLMQWLQEVLKKETSSEKSEDGTKEEPQKKKRKLLVEQKDAFLIPTQTMQSKKKGAATAAGKITGQFLLTEFAFNCLYNGLNKSTRLKDALARVDRIEVLDNFVLPLGEGVQSSVKQVNIVSLRCLTLLFEFELPSFQKEEVVDKLRRGGFLAMNNHCYRTSSDTQMSNATFKFLTALFIRFPEYKIVAQDFDLMLRCIQSYLTSDECSSAALTLLKGILKNKFHSPGLQDLMEEVFKQGILSLYRHINEGCRQAYLAYLVNYCTAPKELTAQVRLILNQFEYAIENGRLTAVEIMNSLVASIPENSLEEVKELIFLKTLATLDKEDQKSVRSKLADLMKSLFTSEGKKSLPRLFLKLLNSDNHTSELDTFFLIAGVLVEDPKIFMGNDFAQLLTKIEQVLNPDSFDELCQAATNMSQQAQDYAIFQALTCLRKALDRKFSGNFLWQRKCPYSEIMELIFTHLRTTHLLYEHVWVPPVVLDIYFHVFTKFQIGEDDRKNKIAQVIQTGKTSGDTLFLLSIEDLEQLTKNIWTLLKGSLDEQAEDIVMKGTLVFVQLTCIAARLDDKTIFEEIIKSVRKSVNHEVVRDPKNTRMRSLAFAIFRSMVNDSPVDAVRLISEGLTRVAARELTDDGIPNELKMEAEKLTNVLRSTLGQSEFNSLYAKVTDFYYKKRNLNRAKKKESFVLHPEKIRKRPKKAPNSVPNKKRKKTK